ncbi:unnamed protein product [Symbiodinium sp. CCMP2592]|nr:unnamed protein product [Symbiodinium sp. CCMP2592]
MAAEALALDTPQSLSLCVYDGVYGVQPSRALRQHLPKGARTAYGPAAGRFPTFQPKRILFADFADNRQGFSASRASAIAVCPVALGVVGPQRRWRLFPYPSLPWSQVLGGRRVRLNVHKSPWRSVMAPT